MRITASAGAKRPRFLAGLCVVRISLWFSGSRSIASTQLLKSIRSAWIVVGPEDTVGCGAGVGVVLDVAPVLVGSCREDEERCERLACLPGPAL